MEQEVLTEVPQSMQRLVRMIVRGFYSKEHAIIIDLLVRNPCMKEDDIIELLKFERKHLRALINILKNEKFLKVRMRVETDEEGKTTRHNYYFVNYLMFVNVVKYKLDHIRRKIEMEERDNTSRASFRCLHCEKTFTDLEADQLFDFATQTFQCTFCQTELQEEEASIPRGEARTLLARFNEKIQPVYDLLRDCEDAKLAPELLDPEPFDMKSVNRSSHSDNKAQTGGRWTDNRTNYNYTENTVTVSIGNKEISPSKEGKDRPIWMTESTVDGASDATLENASLGAVKPKVESLKSEFSDDTLRLLMIHEKKGVAPIVQTGRTSDDNSSSDSDDDDFNKATTSAAGATVAEMDSDEDEVSVTMVTIGEEKVPLHEVTEEMVAKMTAEEKEEYIRLGQEMYEDMYE